MLLDTFVLNNGLTFEFKKLILIPDILILFRRLTVLQKTRKKCPLTALTQTPYSLTANTTPTLNYAIMLSKF